MEVERASSSQFGNAWPCCYVEVGPCLRRQHWQRLLQSGGMNTLANRIEVNAEVMQGKPVIRGTCITVELLLRKLAEGAKTEDLLDAYPRLVVEDIHAALEYAADTIAHETVLELSPR